MRNKSKIVKIFMDKQLTLDGLVRIIWLAVDEISVSLTVTEMKRILRKVSY